MDEIEMSPVNPSMTGSRANPRTRFWVLLTTLGILSLALAVSQTGLFGQYPGSNDQAFRPTPLTPPSFLIQDRKLLANAKLSILFVGNSHTGSHDLPKLVTELVNERLRPGQAMGLYHHVSFLDEAVNDEALRREIESREWNAIVLQAQKISSSGKFTHPVDGGVWLAKHALSNECQPYFYSEWGIQDVPDHTQFTERIYRSMANESGGHLIPVGRVWEAVLADDPDMELYSTDGNHQSRLGASLTALAIACFLLDEPASVFADYDDPAANHQQWKLFVEKISQVQAQVDPK
jgi:hypothetical protein